MVLGAAHFSHVCVPPPPHTLEVRGAVGSAHAAMAAAMVATRRTFLTIWRMTASGVEGYAPDSRDRRQQTDCVFKSMACHFGYPERVVAVRAGETGRLRGE